MASIAKTIAKGKNGAVTQIGGLDDGYQHQCHVIAWTLVSVNPLEDVSGYGDGGESDFEDTIFYHTVDILGYVVTTGAPGVNSLGTEVSAVLTADTGRTYTMTVRTETLQISHRYRNNTPIRIRGRASAAAGNTEAWS